MTLKIIGTGRSLPQNVISNDYLSTMIDTNDDWITSRTGIRERRVAKEETAISMAVDASKAAIDNANILVEDIDLILLTTMTPDNGCPNTACSVQSALGAVNAVSIDLNTCCSGFIFAMSIANAYVQIGRYETILIVSTELLSKILDWNDRSTCILFGDGCGAAVFQAADVGLINLVEHSDGRKAHVLSAGSVPKRNFLAGYDTPFEYPVMDGKEIFKFATTKVLENIKEVLANSNTDISDIKYFILHQANKRIIEMVAKLLRLDIEKFPTNLERYGNTSSASMPILLDELNQKGKLLPGDKVILAGFGGGLAWASALIEW